MTTLTMRLIQGRHNRRQPADEGCPEGCDRTEAEPDGNNRPGKGGSVDGQAGEQAARVLGGFTRCGEGMTEPDGNGRRGHHRTLSAANCSHPGPRAADVGSVSRRRRRASATSPRPVITYTGRMARRIVPARTGHLDFPVTLAADEAVVIHTLEGIVQGGRIEPLHRVVRRRQEAMDTLDDLDARDGFGGAQHAQDPPGWLAHPAEHARECVLVVTL